MYDAMEMFVLPSYYAVLVLLVVPVTFGRIANACTILLYDRAVGDVLVLAVVSHQFLYDLLHHRIVPSAHVRVFIRLVADDILQDIFGQLTNVVVGEDGCFWHGVGRSRGKWKNREKSVRADTRMLRSTRSSCLRSGTVAVSK